MAEQEIWKEKLLAAVGKYADYKRYWDTLENLEKEYDETLELYHWDVWEGANPGTVTEKARQMLRVTSELFWDMEKNARDELIYVLRETKELPPGEQKDIWGFYPDKDFFLEERLEDLVLEWEDSPYMMEDALESFLLYAAEYVKRYLA